MRCPASRSRPARRSGPPGRRRRSGPSRSGAACRPGPSPARRAARRRPPCRRSRPSASRNRPNMSRPITLRSRSTSGSVPSSAWLAAAARWGDSASTADSWRVTDWTRSSGVVPGDLGRVLEQHLAPEQLGEQVVAGGEVGVGRRRRDARAAGDGAHGDRLGAHGAQLLGRGGEQLLDGLGLPGVQLLARQGGHLTGHLSRLVVTPARAQGPPHRRSGPAPGAPACGPAPRAGRTRRAARRRRC